MGHGTVVPKGFLPVFSVDTEEEAKLLIITACPLGFDGHYYARDLAQDQTLENLYAFGEKLAMIHDRLVERGNCTCKPLKKGRAGGKVSK